MTFIAPYARLIRINLADGVMAKIPVTCAMCGNGLFRHESKSGMYFCNTDHKAQWQRQQKEHDGFDKVWLSDQYVSQRKSADQIAREIGRDPKRVWEWLRDYGIATRPRGTDYGHGFKSGNESSFKGRKHSQETKEKIRQRRLADGRVPYLMPDGSHAMKGRNGQQHPAWKGGLTPDRQAFYSSSEWKTACKAVWHRANAQCERCSKHHNEAGHRGTFHIHHIVSFMVRELRAVPSNLVLLCDKCHRFVHSKRNQKKEFIA